MSGPSPPKPGPGRGVMVKNGEVGWLLSQWVPMVSNGFKWLMIWLIMANKNG